jgi:CRISPR-associated protein (TIGR02710 family)
VGGSHEPLVTAIESLKPDRVVFLCSDDSPTAKGSYLQVIGEGKVIKSKPDLEKPDLPNIATLTGLRSDQYKVIKIQNFDNLEDCYRESSDAIESSLRRYQGPRVVADYTGGTKSMTAGLALAAIDNEACDVNLVTGTRADLTRVKDHTQFSRPIVVWDLRGERKLDEVRERLSRYDYIGAAALLETISRAPISEVLRRRITAAIAICRALDSSH